MIAGNRFATDEAWIVPDFRWRMEVRLLGSRRAGAGTAAAATMLLRLSPSKFASLYLATRLLQFGFDIVGQLKLVLKIVFDPGAQLFNLGSS